MDPIASFSGIASGLQWRDMVDQIMRLEISRRMTPVQNQLNAQQQRREAWNTFNGLLTKFSAASVSLRDGTAFRAMQTSVPVSPTSNRALFSASPSFSAAPGTYQIEVQAIARAEKLSGAAVASTAEALGLSGEFSLNGRTIEIAAGDSLARVRDKINAANAGTNASGVSATILSTSANQHRLVLTAEHTGTRGIELVDGGDGILQSLGITTGTFSQNEAPDGSGVQSQRMSSTTSPLAAMLGVTAPPAVTTIDVGGRKITVDLENDTLLSLMSRIATEGGSASISQELVGNRTLHRLSVEGPVTADTDAADPAASQRIVEWLGFQVAVRASRITAGEDARVEIDGFTVTRRTNVIADAIAGVSLNLHVAEPGTTIDLSITRGTQDAVDGVQALAAAYNELMQFVESQRGAGAPLAGNSTLRTVLSSLTRSLLEGVGTTSPGNPFTHASMIGLELTREGRLQVDEGRLREALASNLAEVEALFSTSGSATDDEVQFVSSGDASRAGSYAVVITAPPTQAAAAGSVWADAAAYAAGNGISDTLTVSDRFSGKTVSFEVAQGVSLAAAASQLDALFQAQQLQLTAVVENGALKIVSKGYGSSAGFELSGSAAGTLGLATGDHAGTDVAGTIGGLAATGNGRILTADPGGDAAGIAISYAGAAARAAGDVRFTLGVAGALARLADIAGREGDGQITGQLRSIDRSMTQLNRRLDDAEARLEVRREALIRQFTRMEAAMSRLQSQSNWLASQITAMQPRNN